MNEFSIKAAEKNKLNPKEVIFRYLHYLPWLLLSLLLILSLAWVKLRYSTPIYGVSGKLLVKKSKTVGSGGDKFDDIFMSSGSSSNNLNDEIELIKSRAIAARVVHMLDLQIRYFNKGKIRTSSLHKDDLPFSLHLIQVNDSLKSNSFKIVINEDRFFLGESPTAHYYGESVKTAFGSFILHRKNNVRLSDFTSNAFTISWSPLEQAADALSNSLKVEQAASLANVLNFSFETDNTKSGRNIVNTYMQEYISASLEDRKQTAISTLSFIDDQLDTVKFDLAGVEKNLLHYKQKFNVVDPDVQSKIFFDRASDADRVITEQSVKLKIADQLYNYLNDKRKPFNLVPGTLGIEEPALGEQIAEYNKLQQQRVAALKTMPAANPIIVSLEAGIEKLRTDMLENLANIRNAFKLSLDELNKKYSTANSEISSMPLKERQLQEVTRQQKIMQELYSFLLQKKLETAISSASTISNIKVLDPAKVTGSPIAPNRKSVYMLALFLGLFAPVAVFALIEYLNDKVRSKSDVQRLTETPIIGEIGHADNATSLVVKENDRGYVAEQFRIIRSNLQYILPKDEKPVVLVTSSFSGEGKSFVSTNLAAVLALSGKKTVILEMDIRKPKIMKGLGMEERKGITNYIIGNAELKDIVVKVPNTANLYVIPCGPVPPNPAEILLEEKVKDFFAELKKDFDAIIIDSAPVGLVSDAASLSGFANGSVYIVRHNYTLKKQIELVDSIYKQKKLPKLSIAINDINTRSKYGSYYGYGYGYGYGLGSWQKRNNGYFDGEKKKSWWSFSKK